MRTAQTQEDSMFCTFSGLRIRLVSLLYGTLLFTVAAADLHANRAIATLKGETGGVRRKRLARWNARWTGLWTVMMSVAGLSIKVIVDRSCMGTKGPFIVIGNHFGGFDGAVALMLLRRMYGRTDYRLVAKASMAKVPVLGTGWREMGCAFVERDHRPSDAEAVVEMAKLADEDCADIMIFPEGTVLMSDSALHGNRSILPIRPRGFWKLTQALPTRPIFSFTLYWREYSPGMLSDQGVIPPGTDLVVECRVLPPPGRNALAVLNREWERKAQWLRSVDRR